MSLWYPYELLTLAKEKSPFYRTLYRNLELDRLPWSQVPMVSQEEFWKANSYHNNQLLTGPLEDGIVFKSGGTTGSPKFSFYSHDEWERFTQVFGKSLDLAGLRRGDKVANLFYAGELYASFVFIMRSLDKCPQKVVQFPLGGSMATKEILKSIHDLEINVLVGTPTTMVALAQELIERGQVLPVDKILVGGELLFADQKIRMKQAFPAAQIGSIGYASVDAGHLGEASLRFALNEHRTFQKDSLLEIVDPDTGDVIHEVGRPGKLIYTNLTRSLMPIIRYPVGDMAMWTTTASHEGRQFVLLGRTEEGARIGPVTVYTEDVRMILEEKRHWGVVDFQLMVDRLNGLDRLIVRLGVDKSSNVGSNEVYQLEILLLKARPMYERLFMEGKIAPLKIEVLSYQELERNQRTGKLRKIIDQRTSSPLSLEGKVSEMTLESV